MRTSTFKSILIQLLLLGLLLSTMPAYADGPSIFDLVRQTAAGNVPSPGNYAQFVGTAPEAVSAIGANAAANLRQATGAMGGWSYTAVNGWQFATTSDWRMASQPVAEIPIYAPAYRPPPEFIPGWAARVGAAWLYRIAPLWGAFMYTGGYRQPVNWNQPVNN